MGYWLQYFFMSKEIWKSLRYFSPNENWGSPEKMNHKLLRKLDNLRHKVGHPIHINTGYATHGHSKRSEHYKGNAVDCNCPNISLGEFWIRAVEIGFTGIGAYFDWNTLGLHLDLRPDKRRVFWIRENGIYKYHLQPQDVLEILEK